jgi:hypothetical protein
VGVSAHAVASPPGQVDGFESLIYPPGSAVTVEGGEQLEVPPA